MSERAHDNRQPPRWLYTPRLVYHRGLWTGVHIGSCVATLTVAAITGRGELIAVASVLLAAGLLFLLNERLWLKAMEVAIVWHIREAYKDEEPS